MREAPKDLWEKWYNQRVIEGLFLQDELELWDSGISEAGYHCFVLSLSCLILVWFSLTSFETGLALELALWWRPRTHDPPSSASWVLRLQVCTTTLSSCLVFLFLFVCFF
jgi:hypothetical protein